MGYKLGCLDFNPETRQLSIKNGKGKVTSIQLAKSLNGFQCVPTPTQTELKSKDFHGSSFQWGNITSLNIRKYTKKGLDCYEFEWVPKCWEFVPVDVIDMGGAHWYGGAELFDQRWPSGQQSINMKHYISEDYLQHPDCYGNILEPFWVSSTAVGIQVDPKTPLHVAFNSNQSNELEIKADFNMSKYQNHNNEYPVLKYTICVGKDVKQLWMNMFSLFYKRPTSVPDELMFMSPIWSTWARYKVHVDEEKVLEYAGEIKKHGFTNSQIEIDDKYTTEYGEFDFDPVKFPHPNHMVNTLHKMGFRVTLWNHPFANVGSKAFEEGKQNGYFVKDKHGKDPAIIKWWQGSGGLLDVTNEAAVKWFTRRLKKFQKDYGVDSFKFDAGETTYLPEERTTEIPLVNPCDFTTKYVEAVTKFGPMIETRVGYRSQRFPIFVRVMDKHSDWGYDNGLKSMIPTVLVMGILGYPFILPDMIGGNGYADMEHGLTSTTLPSKELFIRWTQLNAYLPSMQFSIVPWQYDSEAVDISLKAVKEHEKVVTPLVIEAATESCKTGAPIIRPLWWLDAEDNECLTCDSQFLVGNTLLVAPILEDQARSRDIYLPKGSWRDNVRGGVTKGPKWLRNYRIELDEIANFSSCK